MKLEEATPDIFFQKALQAVRARPRGRLSAAAVGEYDSIDAAGAGRGIAVGSRWRSGLPAGDRARPS